MFLVVLHPILTTTTATHSIFILLKILENHTWSRAMQMTLTAKNKLGFVDGSVKQPGTSSPNHGSWSPCNMMVLSWLFNAISNSKDLCDSIIYSDIAAMLWTDLHECFFSRECYQGIPYWTRHYQSLSSSTIYFSLSYQSEITLGQIIFLHCASTLFLWNYENYYYSSTRRDSCNF